MVTVAATFEATFEGHLPDMTDNQAQEPRLPRTVGFWGAALFPVNGMIGSGIFALPAIMVAAVGAMALLYRLVIWSYLAIAPEVIGNESALSAAAVAIMGQAGSVVISLVSVVLYLIAARRDTTAPAQA